MPQILGAVRLAEQAAPTTPDTGVVALYAKSDGKVYIKDDTGAETDITSGGGSADGPAMQAGVNLSTDPTVSGDWKTHVVTADADGTLTVNLSNGDQAQILVVWSAPATLTFASSTAVAMVGDSSNPVSASGGAKLYVAMGYIGAVVIAEVQQNNSGAVPTSSFSAKGDLLVGLDVEVHGTLPVGTDGYILKADSIETTGLRWDLLDASEIPYDDTGNSWFGGTDLQTALDNVESAGSTLEANFSILDGSVTGLLASAVVTEDFNAQGDILAGSGTDTYAVVPVGANNTILTADSAQSGGVGWKTASTLGLVEKTLVDAKGDLIVASAADTLTRLAVGANGKTLVADSTQATGLKWDGYPVVIDSVAPSSTSVVWLDTSDDGESLVDYVDAHTGGRELGYAEITSNFVSTSTTLVDVTGLTTTVTVGSRPIIIELNCGYANHSVANGRFGFAILEDDVIVGGVFATGHSTATYPTTCYRRIRRNPSAGNHTYKIQGYAVDAGTFRLLTGTVLAIDMGPAYIHVTEC